MITSTLRRGPLRIRLTVLVAAVFAGTLLVAGLVARQQFRSALEQNAIESGQTLLGDFLAPTLTGVPSLDGADVPRFVYLDDSGNELTPAELDEVIIGYLDTVFAIPDDAPIGAPEVTGGIVTDVSGAAVITDIGDAELDAFLEQMNEMDPSGTGVNDAFAVELFVPVGSAETVDLDGDSLAVAQPVLVGDTDLAVAVTIPRQSIDDSVAAATRVGVIAIPLLTLLVAVATWMVTARSLQPVEAIRRQVERTDTSRLDHHVPRPGSGDEIDRLAGTMNDMLDRLHAADQQQRRFISDASHELRTPITATLATIESTTDDEIGGRWPEVRRIITDEQHRLGRLVDDLLLLAEMDERHGELGPTDHVDLDEIVLDEVSRPRAVPVHAHVEMPRRITGDERLLRRAVSNLVDNAGRHATSRVDVTVTNDTDGAAVIRVDDDGPGIPDAARRSILDRFARLDEARGRTGGAGLGLAIVQEVARCHHGELRVADNPAGGARFELAIPDD